MRRALLLLTALAGGLVPPAAAQDGSGPGLRDRPVVVASKNFSESRLLGEIFALLLEEEGLPVRRRLGLAGTAVCFGALRSGDVDLYCEYTGTGLVTLLEEPARGGPAQVLQTVRGEFAARWDLVWLAPLGFENAYEVAVRGEVARKEGLRRISDLVPLAGRLKAGFGYEFAQREDGLRGLERVYGLRFGEVVNLQQALKYQAAGAGEVDVLDVYTTDGRILVHDLVVLEDDGHVFPPYGACPLVRGEVLRARPEVAVALSRLAGMVDESRMRRWNRRVEVDGESESAVAAAALEELGLLSEPVTGTRDAGRRGLSLPAYLWAQRRALAGRVAEHLALVGLALALSIGVAVPLGLLLARRRRLAGPVLAVVGVLQTIPSIALLAFMIPLFGVGATPAVAALFLYGLLPIVRNTYTGLGEADPAAVESARALGMAPGQVLRHVRLPLAAPVILAGVRTAAVISVGTATLAAFIGAGGLGVPIVSGLQLDDTTVILSGALPAAALALLVDGLLGLLEGRLRPPGGGEPR